MNPCSGCKRMRVKTRMGRTGFFVWNDCSKLKAMANAKETFFKLTVKQSHDIAFFGAWDEVAMAVGFDKSTVRQSCLTGRRRRLWLIAKKCNDSKNSP